MRKSIVAVLAAVALGTSAVTAAIAAPHGGGGGHMSGGGGGHMGGFGGVGHIGGLGVGHIGDGSIARGGIGGGGVDQFLPIHSSAPHIVTAPSYGAHGQAYARRGDRGHHRGFFFGPGYSGLYAYQPYCNIGWPYDYNYNSCYDSDWND
jgi:hypothetical protein